MYPGNYGRRPIANACTNPDLFWGIKGRLRLAAGDADALSGRYISVDDDLDALLKECSADPSADQRLLRVNRVPAFYEGWKRL
jgi:hypothetical protein